MEPKNVTLTLQVEEVNYLLFSLSKMPYDQVRELIEKVTSQGQAQLQEAVGASDAPVSKKSK